MENPNEYDDEAYTEASNAFFEAVQALWEAGAEEDDIRRQFENALRQRSS